MNHISPDRTSRRAGIAGRLLELNIEALSFIARDKVEHQARQFLSGVPWIVHDGHRLFARTLAQELALITPSLLGSTAFDRLARTTKGRDPADLATIAALRRSQPRLARLRDGRFEDLATGEKRVLLASPPAEAVGDATVFGRFAVTEEGFAIATGLLLELDDDALAIARGFIRPGNRGLGHPLRCAEAIYRHMVRAGNAASRMAEPEPDLPFDPDRNPLDALAAEWAALGRDPGPAEIAAVRAFVGIEPLVNALISVAIAKDHGAARLAAAYRHIAAAVIEFMVIRAAHGSALFSLDRVAAAVDAAIAQRRCGSDTKRLFDELRERARLASGRAPGAEGDLDKLVQRIRALREKTVEQGCTEQEALAAAEKVAELLDRYGLSLSELDLRKQSCEGIGVETNRKRRGPIDDCMPTIATFFDCRVWGETSPDGTLRYIFFGLPADVQASVYLHDLIAQAFATETASFQAGDFYVSTHTSQRRSATNSFQLGLAGGIVEKLRASRRTRDAASAGSAGRALVPVKQSIIDQEMERLGLSFRHVNVSRRRVISDAYSAGKQAGARFEYRPGIAEG